MLANAFATAGAELLAYMGSSSALAAIPETDPPKYVAAGPLDEIAKLLPAFAPASATVLTDERIDEIARKEGDEDKYGFIFNKDGRFSVNSFARAIEVAVLAHAGVTAEPARIPPEIQGMADCMVMVRQELIESGVIDATVAPMFIANAVISKLQEVAAPAQMPAAEVRAQALEEAAEVCEMWNTTPGSRLAREIRSLAQQSTADKASEVRAAEWISVEDTLPEDDCRVIAATWMTMTADQHIDIVSFRRGTGAFSEYPVTHWMPLPAAPSTADSANTGALSEKGAE